MCNGWHHPHKTTEPKPPPPMNRTLQALAGAILAASVPAISANELTFDDLRGTLGFTQPYHGFIFSYTQGPREVGCNCAGSWFWNDANPANAPYYKSPYTSLSTDYELIRGSYFYGESLPISTVSGPIRFDGAWFTSAYEIEIRFHLYYRGAGVANSNYLILPGKQPAVFLSSGYAGPVDSITVEGYQGYFAMDNFIYSPVPEPSSYALLIAGALALGRLARRRNRAIGALAGGPEVTSTPHVGGSRTGC